RARIPSDPRLPFVQAAVAFSDVGPGASRVGMDQAKQEGSLEGDAAMIGTRTVAQLALVAALGCVGAGCAGIPQAPPIEQQAKDPKAMSKYVLELFDYISGPRSIGNQGETVRQIVNLGPTAIPVLNGVKKESGLLSFVRGWNAQDIIDLINFKEQLASADWAKRSEAAELLSNQGRGFLAWGDAKGYDELTQARYWFGRQDLTQLAGFGDVANRFLVEEGIGVLRQALTTPVEEGKERPDPAAYLRQINEYPGFPENVQMQCREALKTVDAAMVSNPVYDITTEEQRAQAFDILEAFKTTENRSGDAVDELGRLLILINYGDTESGSEDQVIKVQGYDPKLMGFKFGEAEGNHFFMQLREQVPLFLVDENTLILQMPNATYEIAVEAMEAGQEKTAIKVTANRTSRIKDSQITSLDSDSETKTQEDVYKIVELEHVRSAFQFLNDFYLADAKLRTGDAASTLRERMFRATFEDGNVNLKFDRTLFLKYRRDIRSYSMPGVNAVTVFFVNEDTLILQTKSGEAFRIERIPQRQDERTVFEFHAARAVSIPPERIRPNFRYRTGKFDTSVPQVHELNAYADVDRAYSILNQLMQTQEGLNEAATDLKAKLTSVDVDDPGQDAGIAYEGKTLLARQEIKKGKQFYTIDHPNLAVYMQNKNTVIIQNKYVTFRVARDKSKIDVDVIHTIPEENITHLKTDLTDQETSTYALIKRMTSFQQYLDVILRSLIELGRRQDLAAWDAVLKVMQKMKSDTVVQVAQQTLYRMGKKMVIGDAEQKRLTAILKIPVESDEEFMALLKAVVSLSLSGNKRLIKPLEKLVRETSMSSVLLVAQAALYRLGATQTLSDEMIDDYRNRIDALEEVPEDPSQDPEIIRMVIALGMSQREEAIEILEKVLEFDSRSFVVAGQAALYHLDRRVKYTSDINELRGKLDLNKSREPNAWRNTDFIDDFIDERVSFEYRDKENGVLYPQTGVLEDYRDGTFWIHVDGEDDVSEFTYGRWGNKIENMYVEGYTPFDLAADVNQIGFTNDPGANVLIFDLVDLFDDPVVLQIAQKALYRLPQEKGLPDEGKTDDAMIARDLITEYMQAMGDNSSVGINTVLAQVNQLDPLAAAAVLKVMMQSERPDVAVRSMGRMARLLEGNSPLLRNGAGSDVEAILSQLRILADPIRGQAAAEVLSLFDDDGPVEEPLGAGDEFENNDLPPDDAMLTDRVVAINGLTEINERMIDPLLDNGSTLIIAELDRDKVLWLKSQYNDEIAQGRLVVLSDLDLEMARTILPVREFLKTKGYDPERVDQFLLGDDFVLEALPFLLQDIEARTKNTGNRRVVVVVPDNI
ncbi:MAG: hypothetical protein Q7S13_03555, partial [Candidatus Omnitrophota bacterium]|nr:hypothetical protein [Candidatus Omnitrophota bacterium]